MFEMIINDYKGYILNLFIGPTIVCEYFPFKRINFNFKFLWINFHVVFIVWQHSYGEQGVITNNDFKVKAME